MFKGMTLNTSPIIKEQGIRSGSADSGTASPVYVQSALPCSPVTFPATQFMNPNLLNMPIPNLHIDDESVAPTAAEQYLQQQQRQLESSSAAAARGSLSIETSTAPNGYTYNGQGDYSLSHGYSTYSYDNAATSRSDFNYDYSLSSSNHGEYSDGALEAFTSCGRSWRSYMSEEGYTYYLGRL